MAGIILLGTRTLEDLLPELFECEWSAFETILMNVNLHDIFRKPSKRGLLQLFKFLRHIKANGKNLAVIRFLNTTMISKSREFSYYKKEPIS